ncbi:MAG: hypothetical protein JW755_10460 [Candidatus Aminicenantes bacterium]|nr:hypothetical protein [Candidatus Aminicenantes bacterium]
MKKIVKLLALCALISGLSPFLSAQFLPEEVAEWPKWEKFLEEAEVISSEQLRGRGAVTEPYVLTLEKDGITQKALWKNPEGRMKGWLEGWKWEIAAYRIDQLLGLNMIPPTIEKRFKGNRGSCQLWVDTEMSLKDKFEKKIKTPAIKTFFWNRAIYLQRFFDNLIANEDRHQQNIRITEDWRMILIDHSRSFRTTSKFTKELINKPEGRDSKPMKSLPRSIYEKVKSLDFDAIRAAVGEYLTDDEINAVLARRDLIVKVFEDLIAEQGEAEVLY